MNPSLQVGRNFSQRMRTEHIKVPEFQLTKHGTEIIKAKKIQVTPVKNQPRSESVRCNFRRVFHIPKTHPNKENRSDELKRVDRSQDAIRHKSLCRGGKAFDPVDRTFNDSAVRQTKEVKVSIPKICLANVAVNSTFLNIAKKEELITFRPEVTPSRKDGRFPRDVFCIDSKRRG